jgi:hypothetical protein
MTPEEEVRKLNRLIRQYESVYHTAASGEQRERVGRELKRLQSYLEKILAVTMIDPEAIREPPPLDDEISLYPILSRLSASAEGEEDDLPAPEVEQGPQPPGELEIARITLYCDFFEKEFLPFLTERRLKLDFKFSMERDSFYRRFQDLKRKITDYHEECARLRQKGLTRPVEVEVRKRAFKLIRIIEVEASRLFRAVNRFSAELLEDAQGDGVKCLNGDQPTAFEKIEGKRHLEGHAVSMALEELSDLSGEIVDFLNVPEIESQENDRADRH